MPLLFKFSTIKLCSLQLCVMVNMQPYQDRSWRIHFTTIRFIMCKSLKWIKIKEQYWIFSQPYLKTIKGAGSQPTTQPPPTHKCIVGLAALPGTTGVTRDANLWSFQIWRFCLLHQHPYPTHLIWPLPPFPPRTSFNDIDPPPSPPQVIFPYWKM